VGNPKGLPLDLAITVVKGEPGLLELLLEQRQVDAATVAGTGEGLGTELSFWEQTEATVGDPATNIVSQGVMPRSYHPTADVMDVPELQRFLDEIRANVIATAGRLPAHMDYMRSYAPAGKP